MAFTETERDAALKEAATAPKRVTVDGNTVETHDPSKVADAIERAAANTNASGRKRGLLFAKMRSPGTA
jgi:hypothetical protein